MNNIEQFKKYWNKKTDNGISYSYKEYAKELEHYLENKKYSVLDLGCGNGNLYHELKNSIDISNYTGIDFSEGNINTFKSKEPKLKLINEDILSVNLTKIFDLIYSNQLFQYLTLSQIELLLKRNMKNIKNGGGHCAYGNIR